MMDHAYRLTNADEMSRINTAYPVGFSEDKKIGAVPPEPPLTLRNYMSQCARQHTVIDNIGRFSINFSKNCREMSIF
jgi:hypothetical protein